MSKKPLVSAGLLLFRRSAGPLEVFLAHPGGPFWKYKDEGAWTIPKGLIDPGEDPLSAACREFFEETGIEPKAPYLPLGSIRLKSGKTIHAWAFEGDANPNAIRSNTMRIEFPPKSGQWITIPEVDRCGWFDLQAAGVKLNAAQAEFLSRLERSF